MTGAELQSGASTRRWVHRRVAHLCQEWLGSAWIDDSLVSGRSDGARQGCRAICASSPAVILAEEPRFPVDVSAVVGGGRLEFWACFSQAPARSWKGLCLFHQNSSWKLAPANESGVLKNTMPASSSEYQPSAIVVRSLVHSQCAAGRLGWQPEGLLGRSATAHHRVQYLVLLCMSRVAQR